MLAKIPLYENLATSSDEKGVVFYIASFEHSFSPRSPSSYISLLYFIFLCTYHIDFSESHREMASRPRIQTYQWQSIPVFIIAQSMAAKF